MLVITVVRTLKHLIPAKCVLDITCSYLIYTCGSTFDFDGMVSHSTSMLYVCVYEHICTQGCRKQMISATANVHEVHPIV